MGFLISINGADFSSYDQPKVAPRRYSYVSDPEAAWPSEKVDKDTPHKGASENAFSNHLSQADKIKYSHFHKSLEKLNNTLNSQKAVLAKHVMSNEVITIGQQNSLQEAKSLMSTHNVRHLPVIDNNRKLVGMISDRDLLKHMSHSADILVSTSVAQGMTTKVFAATFDTLLFEVAHLMLDETISALPILGSNGNLVGILTTTDILKGLIKRAPIELWA